MTIDKKRLNEIVPVSHPIFWFGTILAQKSNNKNYSNNTKTNQVELISSCYHVIKSRFKPKNNNTILRLICN